MDKSLENMTNEELWELFPIILTEYNDQWPALYKDEETIIIKSIGKENIVRIDHIGSTSVPGLYGKPTIDILIQISDYADLDGIKKSLLSINYIFENVPDNPPPHMMFMKGYTEKGFKGQAFHVHIRYDGDWDELYFRDYLIDNQQAFQMYAKLKKHLEVKYKNDRNSYTDAKEPFIKHTVIKARKDAGQDQTVKDDIKMMRAQKEDSQQLLDLQYLAFQSEAEIHNHFDIQPLTQTLDELKEEYEKSLILKAVTGEGEIVGSVRGTLNGNKLYVGKVIVHPLYRGKGLGKKLVLSIEKQYPHASYELYTSNKSDRNLSLYKSLGYKETGREFIAGDVVLVHLEKA